MDPLKKPTFPQLLQDFFCQRLINEQNASSCTVATYRDAFRLLLRYLEQRLGKSPVAITMCDLNASNILDFLNHLETERACTVRTRNNRFAAIRSFLKYAAARQPGALSDIQQVLAVPMKRFNRPQLGYLSRDEVEALLDAPSDSTFSGKRDRVMFATLYNTGIRVSELVGLLVDDCTFGKTTTVRIRGKGRKERAIPLWKTTARQLKRWKSYLETNGQGPIFPNASRQPITRSGVEYRLKRALATAEVVCPSLKNRQITPHTLRHTTAMHMLQSGSDITVIAQWLGHESPATTHHYVESDMKMKERALARVQEPKRRSLRFKPSDKLLKFLESL